MTVSLKRKHVAAVVAFGDLVDFSGFQRRADESAVDRFMDAFRSELSRFRNATGCYLKGLGDGYMAVKTTGKHRRCVTEEMIRESLRLDQRMKWLIEKQGFQRPGGFRIRMTFGRVRRVEPEDYDGRAVTLCYDLLGIRRDLGLVLHGTAMDNLNLKRVQRFGWTISPVTGAHSSRIDPYDLTGLVQVTA